MDTRFGVGLCVGSRSRSAVADLDFLNFKLRTVVVKERYFIACFFLVLRFYVHRLGYIGEICIPAVKQHRVTCFGVFIRLCVTIWCFSCFAFFDHLSGKKLSVIVIEFYGELSCRRFRR